MMMQIEIPCGKGEDAYIATIIGKELRGVFANAGGSFPTLKGKEGEARVAAILALGGVYMIMRRKNGRFNDGLQGEAALVTYNANGAPHAIRRFKNGKLNDGAKGELAVLQFDHHDGSKLVYAASFEEGKRIKALTKQELVSYPVLGKKKRINKFSPRAV